MNAGSPVAVAVVTRDRAQLLERYLLSSLRELGTAGAEIVIVDQSSGDDTQRLVSGIRGVRYTRSPSGLSRGRNEAVRSAEAALIVFTDDDVTLPEGWLGRIVDLFDRHPDVGVVCGHGTTDSGKLLPHRPAGVYRWPANPFALGQGFNIAFRRAALDAAGPFDERLGAGARFHAGEDSDIVYRIMRAGWAALSTDEITVVHHQWRSGRDELRMHFRYGIGVGAQTAFHVDKGDKTALRIALAHARAHVRTFVLALLTLRPRLAAMQVVYLSGVVAGYRAARVGRS